MYLFATIVALADLALLVHASRSLVRVMHTNERLRGPVRAALLMQAIMIVLLILFFYQGAIVMGLPPEGFVLGPGGILMAGTALLGIRTARRIRQ